MRKETVIFALRVIAVHHPKMAALHTKPAAQLLLLSGFDGPVMTLSGHCEPWLRFEHYIV
jgi:hypothetical protein